MLHTCEHVRYTLCQVVSIVMPRNNTTRRDAKCWGRRKILYQEVGKSLAESVTCEDRREGKIRGDIWEREFQTENKASTEVLKWPHAVFFVFVLCKEHYKIEGGGNGCELGAGDEGGSGRTAPGAPGWRSRTGSGAWLQAWGALVTLTSDWRGRKPA